MRDRTERYRQVTAGGFPLTAAPDGAAHPGRTFAIAAAAVVVYLAVVLSGGLSGADTPRPESASGPTMMTSSSSDAAWWTMNEQHPGRRVSTAARRSAAHPHHRRHRHYRHHRRHMPTSGHDLLRPHSVDNATASGRRRFRHVDDKSTSGSHAAVLEVVADPRSSDYSDPIRLEAETGRGSDRSGYFRFCDRRLVSSAVDPVRCRSASDYVGGRCSAELAQLDDEAEVKFQQFSAVMKLVDCGHAYSQASGCDDCKVRGVHSSSAAVNAAVTSATRLRCFRRATNSVRLPCVDWQQSHGSSYNRCVRQQDISLTTPLYSSLFAIIWWGGKKTEIT